MRVRLHNFFFCSEVQILVAICREGKGERRKGRQGRLEGKET